MPTILDKLIVTLGLDATDLKKGHAEAADAAKKGHEQAKKSAKESAEATNKAAEAFAKLTREALTFFAAITSARALKNFAENLTTADAAVGRLAQSMGRAPQEVSAFGLAVEKSGGSAKSAMASFQGYVQSLTELRTTGTSAILPWIGRLQAAGGRQIDLQGKAEQQIEQIATNLARISKMDPAQASFLGKQLGFDHETVLFLMQGPEKVRAMLAEARKYAPTKTDTDAARNLETSLRSIEQAAVSLGRSVVTNLSPWLVDLLRQMQEWIEKNHEWLRSEIVAGVRKFADQLRSIDWNAIKEGTGSFAKGVKGMAEAMGGFVRATEILFALWLGSKALAVVNLMRAAVGLGALSSVGVATVAVGAAMPTMAGDTDPGAQEYYRNNPGKKSWAVEAGNKAMSAIGNVFRRDPVDSPAPGAATAGMRNNNPGNIKYTPRSAQFAGVLGPSRNTDQGDPQAVFDTAENGMRAMVDLARKKFNDGRDTVAAMIAAAGGWTPGNSGAAANIAANMGIGPNDKINLNDPDQMFRFARALIRQEHGRASLRYKDQMLRDAISGRQSEPVLPPPPGFGVRHTMPGAARGGASSNSTDVSIGGVTINTKSGESGGAARDLQPISQRSSMATQANFGLA